jgi:hypothetical protein
MLTGARQADGRVGGLATACAGRIRGRWNLAACGLATWALSRRTVRSGGAAGFGGAWAARDGGGGTGADCGFAAGHAGRGPAVAGAGRASSMAGGASGRGRASATPTPATMARAMTAAMPIRCSALGVPGSAPGVSSACVSVSIPPSPWDFGSPQPTLGNPWSIVKVAS